MRRYRQFGQLDDTLEVFGDMPFQGLDMKSDPATLAAGFVQVCQNLRMDLNGVGPRGGIQRQFPPGLTSPQIFYCQVYRPIGGEDQLAMVTAQALYVFDITTQTMAQYPYPAGQTISASDPVDAEQAAIGDSGTLAGLYIFHGLEAPVLLFDGTTVTVASDVPSATFGLFYQNRLAINSGLQVISCSNFLDFTTWNILNQFQIELGGADYLVGAMAYQGDYVLIGSRKKWFIAYFDPTLAVDGYTGALSNSSFLRLLTSEAGPLGKDAMLETAGYVWFITDAGIFAFQPNLNNELTPLGRPLSADINPVYERLSAKFADQACIQRYGYRLYFALPISDEPLAVTSLTVVNQVTQGLTLPFTVPALLSEGGVATVMVDAPHNLVAGDQVALAGIASAGLNGTWTVLGVLDSETFHIAVPVAGTVTLGNFATAQRLATRNNTIAVFNLNNRDANHPLGMWESIDSLPDGFYADFLRLADSGAQRRLWLVDAVNGAMLYEEGLVDEIGTVLGGVSLPFLLPVTLTTANYASQPVAGKLVSRAYRWEGVLGSPHGTLAYPRNVRATAARLSLSAGDSGTLTTRLRLPADGGQDLTGQSEQTVTFAGASGADLEIFQRQFQRALEVEMELNTTGGQPVLRSLEVQVRKSGQY